MITVSRRGSALPGPRLAILGVPQSIVLGFTSQSMGRRCTNRGLLSRSKDLGEFSLHSAARFSEATALQTPLTSIDDTLGHSKWWEVGILASEARD